MEREEERGRWRWRERVREEEGGRGGEGRAEWICVGERESGFVLGEFFGGDEMGIL